MAKPGPQRTREEVARAEQTRVDAMSDAEVLKATQHGRFGPSIVGQPMHDRSARLLKGNAGGRFGPAILDVDYATKQAAARDAALAQEQGLTDDALLDKYEREAMDAGYTIEAAENIAERRLAALRGGRPVWALDAVEEVSTGSSSESTDPLDLANPRNPWSYVTLGGAKKLAMDAGVSYKPAVKRRDLIAALVEAKIVPPPVPDAEEEDQGEGPEA